MARAAKTFQKQTSQTAQASRHLRGYDNHWAAISRMVRAQHPVCQICENAASVDVDHIIPFRGLRDPLRTDRSNLQAVCRQCHNRKTHGEGG